MQQFQEPVSRFPIPSLVFASKSMPPPLFAQENLSKRIKTLTSWAWQLAEWGSAWVVQMVAWQGMGGSWAAPLGPLWGPPWGPPWGPVEQHGPGAWLAVQVGAWAWDTLEPLDASAEET